MGDVDDIQQAKNDGETERDESDDQSPDQTVEGQRDVQAWAPCRSPFRLMVFATTAHENLENAQGASRKRAFGSAIIPLAGRPKERHSARSRLHARPPFPQAPRPHARAPSAIAANESNSRGRQRILLAEIPVYPRHDRQTFSRELDWQMLVCRMLPAARVRMRHP